MKENKAQRYKKTKKGLIANIYSNQLSRKNKEVCYTLEELREWVHKQQNFEELYLDWINSGYKKEKIPSVDRIDNNKGYFFDNIQLMTWEDNNKKARNDIRNNTLKHSGLLNGGHKKVIQYDLLGNKIDEFISVSEASRVLNIRQNMISRVCRGERNKTNGFVFKYDS